MIITRTPFRISFAGGGSDLEEFYSHEPGMVISTAIDKHMYIAVKEHFDLNFRISYCRSIDVRLLSLNLKSLTVSSADAEAMRWPSGKNATALTADEWPSRVVREARNCF